MQRLLVPLNCYHLLMTNQQNLRRVKYNEKRLQFLDATLPYLVLDDGSVLYNFTYIEKPTGMMIMALNEFNAPSIPAKLWNFKGEDITSYYNHIVEIEYDTNVVYEAYKDQYDEESEEFWRNGVEEHYAKVMEMTDGICEARSIIEGTYEAEKAENARRQAELQRIADLTANDADALPSPEVMQMRMDENQKLLDAAFGENTEVSAAGIITEKPKIITSLNEPAAPTKLIL